MKPIEPRCRALVVPGCHKSKYPVSYFTEVLVVHEHPGKLCRCGMKHWIIVGSAFPADANGPNWASSECALIRLDDYEPPDKGVEAWDKLVSFIYRRGKKKEAT